MNPSITPDLPGIESLVQPFKFAATPHEYKVTALRECPTPMDLQTCDTPEKVAAYWNLHIATNPYFDPERECLAVMLLNTRRRAKGHRPDAEPPGNQIRYEQGVLFAQRGHHRHARPRRVRQRSPFFQHDLP